MSFIVSILAPKDSPEFFCDEINTTSEEMAITIKVRPSGIVLHHCNALGVQVGRLLSEAVECTDFWSAARFPGGEPSWLSCAFSETAISLGKEKPGGFMNVEMARWIRQTEPTIAGTARGSHRYPLGVRLWSGQSTGFLSHRWEVLYECAPT